MTEGEKMVWAAVFAACWIEKWRDGTVIDGNWTEPIEEGLCAARSAVMALRQGAFYPADAPLEASMAREMLR